jgi:hypothetical protein
LNHQAETIEYLLGRCEKYVQTNDSVRSQPPQINIKSADSRAASGANYSSRIIKAIVVSGV